jgi:hypothetical protein
MRPRGLRGLLLPLAHALFGFPAHAGIRMARNAVA